MSLDGIFPLIHNRFLALLDDNTDDHYDPKSIHIWTQTAAPVERQKQPLGAIRHAEKRNGGFARLSLQYRTIAIRELSLPARRLRHKTDIWRDANKTALVCDRNPSILALKPSPVSYYGGNNRWNKTLSGAGDDWGDTHAAIPLTKNAANEALVI